MPSLQTSLWKPFLSLYGLACVIRFKMIDRKPPNFATIIHILHFEPLVRSAIVRLLLTVIVIVIVEIIHFLTLLCHINSFPSFWSLSFSRFASYFLEFWSLFGRRFLSSLPSSNSCTHLPPSYGHCLLTPMHNPWNDSFAVLLYCA